MQQEACKALIDAHVVTGGIMDEATTKSRFNHKSVLINLYEECDIPTQKAIAETLARFYKIPLINLDKITPSPALVHKCKQEQARQWYFLPIVEHGDQVVVGMLDPTDLNNVDTLRHLFRKPIQPVFIYAHDFERGLYRFFRKGADIPEENDNLLDTMQLKRVVNNGDEAAATDHKAIAAKFVRHILTRALACGASDLLIEPLQHESLISLRIEGGTYRLFRLSSSHHGEVVSALRELVKLKEENTGSSQRCSFSLQYNKRALKLLMHFQPSPNGERISVRIIDPQVAALTLDQLQLRKSIRQGIETVLAERGLFLVTGPSGSGKSTAIGAFLRHIAAADDKRKIISLEDLVIEKIPGVKQARFATGANKSSVIAAALKHSPDVLVLDEVTDAEAVGKAAKAAEDALVILSLQADGIAEALARLLRLGLDRKQLSSVLRAIYTQKVIRTICPDCKASNLIHPKTIHQLNIPPSFTFHAGNGCEACKQTGYRGIVTVAELLQLDADASRMLAEGAGGGELYTEARYNGMLTLFEAGLNKAIDGTTSLEEVLAVLPSPQVFDFAAHIHLGRIGPLNRPGGKPEASGTVASQSLDTLQTSSFSDLFGESGQETEAAPETPTEVPAPPTSTPPEMSGMALPEKPAAAAATSDKLSVLLLDDSPVMLQYTHHILESSGLFDVETAGAVDEAWEKLQQHHFHLVITDHEMPVQSGQEFIERIRMQPSLNHTGTMLLTGNLKEASALSAGADGYVSKPTDPELLIARARSIAEIYKRMAGGAASAPQPVAVAATEPLDSGSGHDESAADNRGRVDFNERDMDRIGAFELDTQQFGSPKELSDSSEVEDKE